MPGLYFFMASALMTMLAYGFAHSVPAARRPEPRAVRALAAENRKVA
jgi:hypothetical protein